MRLSRVTQTYGRILPSHPKPHADAYFEHFLNDFRQYMANSPSLKSHLYKLMNDKKEFLELAGATTRTRSSAPVSRKGRGALLLYLHRKATKNWFLRAAAGPNRERKTLILPYGVHFTSVDEWAACLHGFRQVRECQCPAMGKAE